VRDRLEKEETMLVRSLTTVRRRSGLAAGVAAFCSLLAILIVSASAGASIHSQKAIAASHAVASPNGVVKSDNGDRRCKKRPNSCPTKHRLGALRPKKHVRAVAPPASRLVGLPPSVDLTAYAVPVQSQGNLGSCVAWAIDYAMLGWYSRHDGRPGQPFHPMYTFSQITNATGTGSQPADALWVAKSQGNDTIAHYRHTLTDFTTKPNAAEKANAANYKVAGYETLFSNNNAAGGGQAGTTLIKTALAAGKPVAIEMRVRPGFENMGARASPASATDDDISGREIGYHEVLALGYSLGGIVIQNSWGANWGFKGRAQLSWRVVDRDVISAYTIDGFAGNNTPTPTPAPRMGDIVQQFPLDQLTTSATAPVTFRWSASSPLGIAAYEVYVKRDDGGFWKQDIPSTATEYTWSLAFGHSYQVAVKAQDRAGHWSTYSYSTKVSPGIRDDAEFGNVNSPWGRYTLAGTFGGTYIAAAAAGAWVQLSFTGTDVAMIPVKFANAGRATIYCDGVSAAFADFYSAATVVGRIGAFCHFVQSGQHTMKVVAEGTSGRSWLGIDAFATF
jgi:hypothetical protein